ncbi:efflux transporter, outer membrane factor (OMF) lipoprotein, NodT family [Halopseudomonas xinjiangensis]|uniref:Efflux transporter, outer membrane factor (OMF) lipoprotein, NodT family n=2 Tax=Halopseudomonas xinjiangensis TaxID=487184 RepID=A0A1H1MX28_9GAMM|nr:efflux transporter, outer membrane factor (OMF) lipoprotein, NodT family [Halopseudomonas xinjiangensis]
MLTGCAINTPQPDASVAMPATWNTQTRNEDWPSADWWRAYQAPALDALLEQARLGNLDLATSAAQLLQADAQLQQAGASLLPQVSGSFSASRSQSENQTSSQTSSNRSSFGAALNASYEVDFWGRNRATVESARATLQASRFDRETLGLGIDASVASTWFQWLEVQERLALARRSLDNAERVLQLIDARQRFGAADQLEVSQQRTLVLQLRASLPALEQSELQLRNALALLLGTAPGERMPATETLGTLVVPEIGAGLPAELLARRPDIRASEARLAAANADLNAARAALYPSIQLTGQLGVQSLALSGLVNDPTSTWNLVAGLTQPIFQGGRLRAQVDLSEARQQELLVDYRRTVLQALQDADTALGAVYQARVRFALLEQATAEAQRAFELAETRYRAGAITQQSLLDTQRTWYQSQDTLLQQRSAWLQSTVDLFRALGGGWQEPALSYAEPPRPGE